MRTGLLTRRLLLLGSGAGALLVLPSCVHVSSDPIEVKPIHIVADINLRIDRQLDDFFAFENKYQPPSGSAATQASTTQPAEPQPTRMPQPM